MKGRRPPSALRPPAGSRFRPAPWVWALVPFLLFVGCTGKPKFQESRLPLPPGVDSGVYDGKFVQSDYGFGFPQPAKWLYLRLSADQEVDEVARFCDPSRQLVARVSVAILGAGAKASLKDWPDRTEEDLKGRLFKVKKKEDLKGLKTEGGGTWRGLGYRLTDPKNGEWADQEWALAQDDLLIGVHAALPAKLADTDKGKKLLLALEEAIAKIEWYTPIGPRGISVERYELQHFTEGFRGALETGTLNKTTAYFDEMYPARAQWAEWYKQACAGEPDSFELRAELNGLVINGDLATAYFIVTRKDKGSSKPQRSEKGFHLSKKEGHWEIMSPVEKM